MAENMAQVSADRHRKQLGPCRFVFACAYTDINEEGVV